MSQQTSISNYFKAVNPKRSLFVIKPENIAAANLKKKVKTPKRRMKKEPPLASTPSKIAKTSLTQSSVDFIDLIDCDGDLTALNDADKTPNLSLQKSFDGNSPATPTKSPRNLKRTLSASRSSGNSSPKKKPQSNGSRSVTKHLKHRGPRKLFHEAIDTGRVSDMIENLNLSRAGVFPKNQFNLEEFYSSTNSEADVVVECNMDDIFLAYDFNGVIIPRDKHAEHLFYIITDVFSNAINCGYFDDRELDTVFSILTLSEKAQMLFARMIKRKHDWIRVSSVKYPEIDDDLRPYFQELETHDLYTSGLENVPLASLLGMLLADEIHDICKQSRIPRQSNKELAVQKLLKNSFIKPLFPGTESPATVLRRSALTSLDYCVYMPETVISLVDRIVTLFIPSEDVSSKLSDMFLKLTLVKEGNLRYPEIPVQHYPVFESREHLVRYVESRNKWRQAMEMPKGNKEHWEKFITLGRDADARLASLLGENPTRQQVFAIPRHVQNFREEYVCIKIVTTCLEVFKKEDATIPEAVDMLRNLISQEIYLQSRKGQWYEELALIEMKHRKNLEAAALLTIKGLTLRNITETDKHVLTKRASTLAKRKSGLDNNTKFTLKNLIDQEMLTNTPTVSINASVMQGNQPGRKSTWAMDMGGGDKGYMKVELRAQYYYKNNGYPYGWHCEGSLPVTLFTLLMWDELYSVSVPAAYLSAYQKAPLDLYTSEFYKNRKERIDKRIEEIKAMSADELGNAIERSWEIRQHYESLMPTSLSIEDKQLKDIARCMGASVVSGICQRLASNFSGWRAGFPDLLVWNSVTLKCKFVEVKGPGDTLSAKQTLWLRYLEGLGAAAELCEVKGKPVLLFIIISNITSTINR